MAITYVDPDEGRRQRLALLLQGFKQAQEAALIPSQIQEAQAKAKLAQAQAGALSNPFGLLPGTTQPTSSSPLPSPALPLNQRLTSPGMVDPQRAINTPFGQQVVSGMKWDSTLMRYMPELTSMDEAVKSARDAKGQTIDASRQQVIQSTMESILRLRDVIERVQTRKGSEFQTGPLLAGGSMQMRNALGLGNLALQTFGTPGEADFMAKHKRLESSFLTSQTGAQRGFPEIEFLSPALPQPSKDTPEKFLSKAEGAVKELTGNLGRMLTWLEDAGFNTSDIKAEIENTTGAVVAVDKDGNRAFIFPDGSIQEI